MNRTGLLMQPGNITASTSSQQILGPNEKRYGVLIMSTLGIRSCWSFGHPAAMDQDIVMFPGTTPLWLGGDILGEALHSELNVMVVTSTSPVSVLDFYFP